MKSTNRYVRLGLLLASLAAVSPSWAGTDEKVAQANADAMQKNAALFRENKGQWDKRANFLSQNPGLDYWVTNDGLVLDFYRTVSHYKPQAIDKNNLRFDKSNNALNSTSREGHVVKVEFVGGNKAPMPAAFGPLGHLTDFMVGPKSRHARGVRSFQEVGQQGVYNGIDVRHYRDAGQIRYDFIVKPGANPNAVKLKFSGADVAIVGDKTSLKIKTSIGDASFANLYTYQPVGNTRRVVKSAFKRIADNEIGIELGAYDPRLPLVIDPLVYGSYLGSDQGGDVPSDEFLNGVAVDKQGNLYAVGVTSSPYFPVNFGAYDRYNPDGIDAFVNKMDADAYSVSYSVVLGGSGTDNGLSISFNDLRKELWVGGTTTSADFGGAVNAKANGTRCWFGRFTTSTGTPVPDFTQYANDPGAVSGNGVFFGAIETSSDGKVYIGGDGPTAGLNAGGFTNVLGGAVTQRAAWVVQYQPDGTLGFKRMIGGLVRCFYGGMAVAPDGSIGVSGTIANAGVEDTSVANPPTFVTTAGVYPGESGKFQGGRWLQNLDVFCVQMNSAGTLNTSFTLGGAGDDVGSVMNYDQYGNVFVTSLSDSFNFQRTRNAFDQLPSGKVMVTKLSPNSSELLYSTGLRDQGAVFPTAIAIDNRGVASVGGVVSFNNLANPFDPCSYVETIAGAVYQTEDALNLVNNKDPDGLTETVNASNAGQNPPDFPATQDGFITFVNPSGTGVLYSDFIGGSAEEQVTDVVVDATGSTWVAGFYLQAWSRGLLALGQFIPRQPKDTTSNPIAPYITGNAFKISAPVGSAINDPQAPDQCPMTPVPGVPEFATSNGWIVKLRVQLPILNTITLAPSAIAGGNGATSTATITLRDPAPAGGVNMTVSLSNASATSFSPTAGNVSTVVTIPGGANAAQVTVYSLPVTAQTTSEVRATLDNDFIAARLTISPWLNDFSVSPASVVGGNNMIAKVVLFQPAPAGGVTVPLSTDRPDLIDLNPASITVPQGAVTANAVIATHGVDATTAAKLTANFLQVVKQVDVTLTRAKLASFEFVPDRLNRRDTSIGTIRLDGETGTARNVTISYVSGPAGAKINGQALPAVVQIPAKAKTLNVTLTAPDVTVTEILTLKADDGGTPVFGSVTIDPIDIAAVDVTPGTDIIGGTVLQGRVILTRPAGPNGLLITLSSSNPNAGDLSTNQVLVPAGQVTSQFFEFQTAIKSSDQFTNIHATRNGFSDKYVHISVRAVKLTVKLNPSTVTGGVANSSGSVTLTAPAPPGGLIVDLTSSDTTAATVPSSIVINAGSKSKSFSVQTRKVPETKIVTISAQAAPGVGASAKLTVTPPKITSISFDPSTVGLQQQTKGTLTFESGVAGGTVVQLTATPAGALNVPATVTVTGGLNQFSFYAKSGLVANDTTVTVTAKLGSSTVTTTVLVRVPSVASLTFNPTRVVGGSNSMGTVTLDAAAPPNGVTITLSSGNPAYADIIGSKTITIGAGKKSGTFSVKSNRVSRTVAVQFTATSQFGTVTGYLYVDP